MRGFLIAILLTCFTISYGQLSFSNTGIFQLETTSLNHLSRFATPDFNTVNSKKKFNKAERWKLTSNKYFTGGLMLLAGAAKGFNETLEFNWRGFAAVFPDANPKWFYPQQSFSNKYKDGDPAKGEKFPLSSSVLVMVTDQYHLNNFIQRGAITAALVIKLGEGKKPIRYYIYDILYYSACYQVGFGGVYYYFKSRM